MAFGGIGADHHHHVRVGHRIEILGSRRGAEGLLQAVAGGGVANPRAGIHVVVAERGAHHFLHCPHFLVGAARRRDAADGFSAMLGLDGFEALGGVVDGLLPRHFAPRIVGGFADHRRGDALAMVGVAPREAALHAGMAVVRLAVLVRHHAHHLVALHFGAECAADAAVGAGGIDAAIRHAVFHHGFLHQRRRRTCLYACAARDAFRIEEGIRAGGHLGGEAAAVDGEGEGALHFVAGAYATRADDALRGIEREIWIR